MSRNIIIRFTIIAIVALSAFLILRSSSIKKHSPNKESIEDCCQKKCKAPAENNLIWETFSRQFISIVF